MSVGRGYLCPAYTLAVSPFDEAVPKHFARLLTTVRDRFEDDEARTTAVAEDIVFEGHVASAWLARVRPASGNPKRQPAAALQPSTTRPAVVNTVHLANESAQVGYFQVPYSLIRGAFLVVSIDCIKRAHVTVLDVDGTYFGWWVGRGPLRRLR